MNKSELFYEEESKTARPHKYSINYKDKNDSVYAIKFYSMQKQIDERDKEIERLDNIINELYRDLKTLWIVLWNMDTEMTGYQNEIFNKYYDEFHNEELEESSNNDK